MGKQIQSNKKTIYTKKKNLSKTTILTKNQDQKRKPQTKKEKSGARSKIWTQNKNSSDPKTKPLNQSKAFPCLKYLLNGEKRMRYSGLTWIYLSSVVSPAWWVCSYKIMMTVAVTRLFFAFFLLPIDNRSLPIDSEKKGTRYARIITLNFRRSNQLLQLKNWFDRLLRVF